MDKSSDPLFHQQQRKRSDPLVLIVHLLLTGIVVLFLGFSYAYIFSDQQEYWKEFRIPKILWLSTVSVLGISYFLKRVLLDYKKDESRSMKLNLLTALFLSLVFITCQVIAFRHLHIAGFTMEVSPSSAYMFLLAGLHGVHISVGILFLIVAVLRLYIHTKDDVKRLIYFSDPEKKTRLTLLMHYWHTIDFLWVFLFLLILYQHA